MQILSGYNSDVSTSVALGEFDAVHIGHMKVIDATANRDGLRRAVLTFKRGTLHKGDDRSLLLEEDRAALLESMGVELLCEPDFAALKELSPEAFVKDVLLSGLRARRVICGENYRFGAGAQGDSALLKRLCEQGGAECIVIPIQKIDGNTVSSTAIRKMLDNGEPDVAEAMLGRPFSYCLEVVSGQQLGRKLGAPTINQLFPDYFLIPKFGVYASMTTVDDRVYPSVTNIGIRPTVGSNCPLSETWIDGFSGDIYGRSIKVELLRYLRGEKRFDSLDKLKEQIASDSGSAAEIFKSRI